VEDGIAALQAKYDECLAKRDELDAKCKLCEGRLVRADKVRRAQGQVTTVKSNSNDIILKGPVCNNNESDQGLHVGLYILHKSL